LRHISTLNAYEVKMFIAWSGSRSAPAVP